ncbi:hypothetical protein ACJMK2_011540 [Sinanodonta woodiana]|uniref:Uncharacterized protein n=1 Tax=Sinanodonta woodiana TaxID=1069815 RepID=A0ABD3V6M2_SINWO
MEINNYKIERDIYYFQIYNFFLILLSKKMKTMDIDLLLQDKENVATPSLELEMRLLAEDSPIYFTPHRVPLQDVKQLSLNRHIKKACYSNLHTPSAWKTPRRKSIRLNAFSLVNKGTPKYISDYGFSSAREKRTSGLFCNKQEDLARQLAATDKMVFDLENKLFQQKTSSPIDEYTVEGQGDLLPQELSGIPVSASILSHSEPESKGSDVSPTTDNGKDPDIDKDSVLKYQEDIPKCVEDLCTTSETKDLSVCKASDGDSSFKQPKITSKDFNNSYLNKSWKPKACTETYFSSGSKLHRTSPICDTPRTSRFKYATKALENLILPYAEMTGMDHDHRLIYIDRACSPVFPFEEDSTSTKYGKGSCPDIKSNNSDINDKVVNISPSGRLIRSNEITKWGVFVGGQEHEKETVKYESDSESPSCKKCEEKANIEHCHQSIHSRPTDHSAQCSSTTACSPFSTITADTSIQNVADMQSISVQCSPPKAFTVDFSHVFAMTHTPEKCESCDKEIQCYPERTSVMCSPVPRLTVDTSTQNVVIMESICVSPMPVAARNIGMMTDVPTTVEVGVGSDTEMVDKEVSAMPVYSTASTLTEASCVENSETSMTPFKILNKKGRRLTADEVRKQHPRALANQLDTMNVCNERLKTEVLSLEHEQTSLRNSIKELRAENSKLEKQLLGADKKMQEEINQLMADHKREIIELEQRLESVQMELESARGQVEELIESLGQQEDKYIKDTHALETCCKTLEDVQKTMSKQHNGQLEQLKEDFDKADYQDHFLKSQQLVHELETQLSNFTELADKINSTRNLQAEFQQILKENFDKVTSLGNRMINMKEDFNTKVEALKKDKEVFEAEVSRFEVEKQALKENEHEMATTLEINSHNLMQMETMYESMSTDLIAATAEVCSLRKELLSVQEALRKAQSSKAEIAKQMEDQEENEQISYLEIQTLQASLQIQDKELEKARKRMQEMDITFKERTTDLQDTVGKYELLVTNLQRTLEMREQDIDTLESDTFELREVILIQMDKIKDLETSLKSATEDLEYLRKENLELRELCAVKEAKIQRLSEALESTQEDLSSTQEELSSTQSHATQMLTKQQAEITCGTGAIAELLEKMTMLLSNLQKRSGLENESFESRKLETVADRRAGNSLVCQVLMAAKNDSSAPADLNNSSTDAVQSLSTDFGSYGPDLNSLVTSAHSTSDYEFKINMSSNESSVLSPGAFSRDRLGFSQNSAFAPIKSGRKTCTESYPALELNQNQATEVTPPKAVDNSNEVSHETDGLKQDEDLEEHAGQDVENTPLMSQLRQMSDTLEQIIHLANLIDKASRMSLREMKTENEDLNCQLVHKEYAEMRLKAELELKENELKAAQVRIDELFKTMSDMGDKFGHLSDQESEVKLLHDEVIRLKSKLHSVEGEKEMLDDQLKELLDKIESQQRTSSSCMLDPRSEKEVIALKKKNQRLREQLTEKQEYIEAVGKKASRRMTVLEENWKQAEKEVFRFDELVENVRQTLVKNLDVIDKCEPLRRLIKMIDGEVALSSEKQNKQSL